MYVKHSYTREVKIKNDTIRYTNIKNEDILQQSIIFSTFLMFLKKYFTYI